MREGDRVLYFGGWGAEAPVPGRIVGGPGEKNGRTVLDVVLDSGAGHWGYLDQFARATECCGRRLAVGPHGGEHEASCRECERELCSGCAGVYECEGGYGDDGQGVRTFALCCECYGEREEKRQRREARADSGV